MSEGWFMYYQQRDLPCRASTGLPLGSPHSLPAMHPHGTGKLTVVKVHVYSNMYMDSTTHYRHHTTHLEGASRTTCTLSIYTCTCTCIHG